MIEKISEFLKNRIKPEKINIELKYFDITEPDKLVFAIDSGYRKVLEIGREGLYFLRFGYVKYNKSRRTENKIDSTFVYISEDDIIDFGEKLNEKELSYFKAKLWDLVENKGMEYDISEKIIIGGIARLLELKTGKDLSGIVIFDFPFDFRFEIHGEVFEKISSEKVGLAKKSRLKGYSDIIKIRKEGRWYIETTHESFGKDFFVKYGTSIKCIPFRTSIDKKIENPEELFGKLAYYADETKRGYIFPLIRIDKLVRVDDYEIRRIRKKISTRVGDVIDFDVLSLKF